MGSSRGKGTGRARRLVKGIPASELRPYTVRLSSGTKSRLSTLANVTGTPAYQLVERAILKHLERQTKAVKDEVERRVAWEGD